MDVGPKHEAEKLRIASVFRELREHLKCSVLDISARSIGRLPPREIQRLEAGRNLLTSLEKRRIVAKAYGLSLLQLAALIDGSLSPKYAAEVALGDGASVAYPVAAIGAAASGDRLGTFVRLHHATASAFPQLEICLLYNELNGHCPWSESTIAGARKGEWSKDDLRPKEWEDLLNRVESVVLKAVEPIVRRA